MLRSTSRPRLRLAAAGVALCGALAACLPALAASAAPAGGARRRQPFPWHVDLRGRRHRRGRHPEPVHRIHQPGLRGLRADLRQPDGLRPAQLRGTPRLATSWSHSKNGLVWTYHIRHGVKWSDGVPLTAADVAYTFQRNIRPNSTEFADNEAYVGEITSAVATGKYTVVMKVKHYTPG